MKSTIWSQIRVPCELKDKVKRLARQNGISPSDLVRLSIEAKLPDCEAGGLMVPTHGGHQEKSTDSQEL